MLEGYDPQQRDLLRVFLRSLVLQLVEFIECIDAVIEHVVAEEDVEGYLELVERTQSDIRQISQIALKRVLVAATTDRSIVTHGVVLQSWILCVEATHGAPSSLMIISLFFRSQAGSIEIDMSILVATLVKLEDAPVEVEVLHIENVLVIVAIRLEALQILSIHRLI